MQPRRPPKLPQRQLPSRKQLHQQSLRKHRRMNLNQQSLRSLPPRSLPKHLPPHLPRRLPRNPRKRPQQSLRKRLPKNLHKRLQQSLRKRRPQSLHRRPPKSLHRHRLKSPRLRLLLPSPQRLSRHKLQQHRQHRQPQRLPLLSRRNRQPPSPPFLRSRSRKQRPPILPSLTLWQPNRWKLSQPPPLRKQNLLLPLRKQNLLLPLQLSLNPQNRLPSISRPPPKIPEETEAV